MNTRETCILMKKPIYFGLFTGSNEPIAGDLLLDYG